MSLFFTVGPAQLYTGVKDFLCEQIQNDLGSLSHRSKEFSAISESALRSFRSFFNIPSDYSVFYVSSATEGLALVSESLCSTGAVQVNNGSFGKLWCDLSRSKGKAVTEHAVSPGMRADITNFPMQPDTDLITITTNETSTGVMYTADEIAEVRKKYPEKMLAVDVTSILGVYAYNFSNADAWVFSVQKAFGLPAGLGIMVLSPRAVQKAIITMPYIFGQLVQKMEVFQTPCTPNVLTIAAFGFVCDRFTQDFGSAEALSAMSIAKAEFLYDSIQHSIPWLMANTNDGVVRSVSTPCFSVEGKSSSDVVACAAQQGVVIGKGYGKNKDTQVRIANFPVHSMEDIQNLASILQKI